MCLVDPMEEVAMQLRRGTLVLLGTLASVAGPVRAQEPLADVRIIASDTLRDVAVTIRESGRAVIYYNPELLARFGPLLKDFFIAHEYGHVAHGHTGGALAPLDARDEDRRLKQELEADCYAAAQLGPAHRSAVEAAVRLFTRMGPFRYDKLHPTGSQRAAQILACLPPPPAPQASSAREVSPARDSAAVVDLSAEARAGLRGTVRVAIDGRTVGTLTTVSLGLPLRLRHLHHGVHRYELVVQVFTLDDLLQLNPSGEVRAGGKVEVLPGGRLEVAWSGKAPALLAVHPVEEQDLP
jgi:hypothetical protein